MTKRHDVASEHSPAPDAKRARLASDAFHEAREAGCLDRMLLPELWHEIVGGRLDVTFILLTLRTVSRYLAGVLAKGLTHADLGAIRPFSSLPAEFDRVSLLQEKFATVRDISLLGIGKRVPAPAL